jgi:hypothetical protein
MPMTKHRLWFLFLMARLTIMEISRLTGWTSADIRAALEKWEFDWYGAPTDKEARAILDRDGEEWLKSGSAPAAAASNPGRYYEWHLNEEVDQGRMGWAVIDAYPGPYQGE